MFSLVLNVSASTRWRLAGGDITATYLQRENITRILLLSPPEDGIEAVEPVSLVIAQIRLYQEVSGKSSTARLAKKASAPFLMRKQPMSFATPLVAFLES